MLSHPAHSNLWGLIPALESPQRRTTSISFSLNLQTDGPEVTVYLVLYVYTDGFVNTRSTVSHKHTRAPSVQLIMGPQGDLWLHQHKGNPSTSSAFLLKYNSPHLASWHHFFGLSQSPLPPFSFSLPGQNTAIITLFYFAPPLQCTTFNLYLSILFLMSFCPSAPFFFLSLLTSKVRQDKQCHWCQSERGYPPLQHCVALATN